MFEVWLRIGVSLFFLILIEIIYLLYKNGKLKRVKEGIFENDLIFNRPISFFVFLLLLIFLSHYFLLPNLVFELILLSLFAIVIQVLLEEWIFRGLLFNQLLKFYKIKEMNSKFIIVLLFQAFLFTIMHITTQNPIGVFISGIIFGLAYVFNKNNILLPTTIHILGNLLVYFGAFSLAL